MAVGFPKITHPNQVREICMTAKQTRLPPVKQIFMSRNRCNLCVQTFVALSV